MRLIGALIKGILLFVIFGIVAFIVTIFLLIGGLFMLISGRRPRFRVYTRKDFEMDVFERPPMRDVTPKTVDALPPRG